MTSISRALYFLFFVAVATCRQHFYSVKNDLRSEFDLATFGLTSPGFLFVNISNLQFSKTFNDSKVIGLTLDRADSAGISPYIEHRQDDRCIFHEKVEKFSNSKSDVITMVFNFKNMSVRIARHGAKIEKLPFYRSLEDLFLNHSFEFKPRTAASLLPPKFQLQDEMASTENSTNKTPPLKKIFYKPELLNTFTLLKSYDSEKKVKYSFQFLIYIANRTQIGLYNLFFHNCENIDAPNLAVSFDVRIVEKNGGNYLTAFEVYLPTIYLAFATIYFCCCVVWSMVLRKGEEGSVHKIHYLMLLLVAVKSLSVFVHSIDYHFINVTGHSHNTWAVLYYFTYVIRGLLLFTILILIGSGWQLMKHVFSTNEKRVFVLVISLQVITNLAYVLKENTEEGAEKHELWQQVFILVDLVCCGTVLFPIVWSIRHLQEATKVDGKGSANLVKLRLFRRFYITIVCYIYFTRIVVYLLRILVNFQYRWLDAVCTEGATLAFFIFTAYTFRPNSDNPYIRLSQAEDDSDYEETSMRQFGANRSNNSSNSPEHGSENNENTSEFDHDSPRRSVSPSNGNPNWSANIRRKLNPSASPTQNSMQKSIV